MSDDIIKRLLDALAAGPTPGPWEHIAKLSASESHRGFTVGVRNGWKLADVRPIDEDGVEGSANAAFIAACHPEAMRALLDRLAEREAECDRLREDAARLDWLAEQLQDVQIGETDPTAHYLGDETDVPWPTLWRRAIDAARGKK